MSEYYHVPVEPDDLIAIATMLRERDVFTPTFATSGDWYDPTLYIQEAIKFATQTVLLADRNLLTRWVSIAQGEQLTTPEHKYAAGVIAFCQCSEIVIEPNIALYEVAHTMGDSIAHEELQVFRIADHIDPNYWVEVALSRADGIGHVPQSVPTYETDSTINFCMALRGWRRNYILALKIAELELQKSRTVDKMAALMKWMYDDFKFSGGAMALAAHYFAPNQSRKGLLKYIKSPDRERTILGLRNAAWDMTLVSQWMTAINQQESDSKLVLLASLDRNVHSLARSVADVSGIAEQQENPLLKKFIDLWGSRDGHNLAQQYQAYQADLTSSSRQINSPAPTNFIDQCIVVGEQKIRQWSANNTSL